MLNAQQKQDYPSVITPCESQGVSKVKGNNAATLKKVSLGV